MYKVMENADQIISDYKEDKTYDVFFALDASDKGRLAGAVRYFDTAKKTVCIDHHISNEGFCHGEYYISPRKFHLRGVGKADGYGWSGSGCCGGFVYRNHL